MNGALDPAYKCGRRLCASTGGSRITSASSHRFPPAGGARAFLPQSSLCSLPSSPHLSHQFADDISWAGRAGGLGKGGSQYRPLLICTKAGFVSTPSCVLVPAAPAAHETNGGRPARPSGGTASKQLVANHPLPVAVLFSGPAPNPSTG